MPDRASGTGAGRAGSGVGPATQAPMLDRVSESDPGRRAGLTPARGHGLMLDGAIRRSLRNRLGAGARMFLVWDVVVLAPAHGHTDRCWTG